MLTDLLFFLITGATLSLLIWTGLELFRNQEDPLATVWKGCSRRPWWWPRAPRAADRRWQFTPSW